MSLFQQLYKLQHEQWGILDVLIADKSPIDLSRLAISDAQDAYDFVLNYGYDLNKQEESLNVAEIKAEAIQFLEQYLLPAPPSKINQVPSSIQQASPIELLLLASSSTRSKNQKWACAILRVMHTIAHITSHLSANFFPSIQDQILTPYKNHIQEKKGKLFLGVDPHFQIELVEFHAKAGKERHSAILKLLHKADNVAADIFDRIGVRFITKDKLDSLLILKYLREYNLVTFPNVKPSRSLNTLINMGKFKQSLKTLYQNLEDKKITMEAFEHELRHQVQFEDTLSSRQIQTLFNRNPHTSRKYRSIQFTVRQLVQIENPLSTFQKYIDTSKMSRQEQVQLKQAPQDYRFFFPYEIQLIDQESHKNNLHGQASHDGYKIKQLESARKRVLGRLLDQA